MASMYIPLLQNTTNFLYYMLFAALASKMQTWPLYPAYQRVYWELPRIWEEAVCTKLIRMGVLYTLNALYVYLYISLIQRKQQLRIVCRGTTQQKNLQNSQRLRKWFNITLAVTNFCIETSTAIAQRKQERSLIGKLLYLTVQAWVGTVSWYENDVCFRSNVFMWRLTIDNWQSSICQHSSTCELSLTLTRSFIPKLWTSCSLSMHHLLLLLFGKWWKHGWIQE
jgi:hypothetical protein